MLARSLLFLSVLNLACPHAIAVDTKVRRESLVGSYRSGQITGYVASLDLRMDGTYVASCAGCGGLYGEAKGKWVLKGSKIICHPTLETDLMKRNVRDLQVYRLGDRWILTQKGKLGEKFLAEMGPDNIFCFQRSDLPQDSH